MRRYEIGAAAALLIFGLVMPTLPGYAAPIVIAQAEKEAVPVASPTSDEAKPGQMPAQAPAIPGATASAPAKKSALSTPVCSVKYLEAKVTGKLKGRPWVDFRREECGEKETTAVFPTTISPKYANEKDLDKARRQTCADQFTANKATDANGGLKWIERDGGYYGECISRLHAPT